MKIGYLRISTDEQNPDRQIDGLQAVCDEMHVETLSATKKTRPIYDSVIAKLKTGDTFVIWDLDRAFRSTVDAILEAEKLRERGIEFQIVTMQVDTSTPTGELYYTIVAAYATFERKNLIKRTKEGMTAARKRGKHVGRPLKLTREQITHARNEIEAERQTIGGMASVLGVDRGTLSRALKTGANNG